MTVRDAVFVSRELRREAESLRTILARSEEMERRVYSGEVNHAYILRLVMSQAQVTASYLESLARITEPVEMTEAKESSDVR